MRFYAKKIKIKRINISSKVMSPFQGKLYNKPFVKHIYEVYNWHPHNKVKRGIYLRNSRHFPVIPPKMICKFLRFYAIYFNSVKKINNTCLAHVVSKFWDCIFIGESGKKLYVTRLFFAMDIHFRLKNSSNTDISSQK